MLYPLGNDEQGIPIDLPPEAAGWLVRRHAGGRGRPGTVYGVDGRPLVLPLSATAADLRAAGVGPGTYRLDAVGEQGKPVGAPAAYTELTADGSDPLAADAKVGSSIDAALMMLTRLLEKDYQARAEERRQDRELLRQALVQNHETIRAVVARNVELTAPRLSEPTLKTVDQIADRVRQDAAASEARRNAAPAPELTPTDPWVGMLLPVVRPVLTPIMEVAAQEVTLWKERRRQSHDARLDRGTGPVRNGVATAGAPVAAFVAQPPTAVPAPARAPEPAAVPALDPSSGSYAFDLDPGVVDDEGDADEVEPCGGVDERDAEPGHGDDADERADDSLEDTGRSSGSSPVAQGVVKAAPASSVARRDEETPGPEMLAPLLSAIGVPAADVDAIADRLDVVLEHLPVEDMAAIGALLERATPIELAIVRDLLAPLARMSREEAITYASKTIVPVIAQHRGSKPPGSEV